MWASWGSRCWLCCLAPAGGGPGASGAGGRPDRLFLDPDDGDHPAGGRVSAQTFGILAWGLAEEPDDRLGRPWHRLGRDRACAAGPGERVPDPARGRRHALRAFAIGASLWPVGRADRGGGLAVLLQAGPAPGRSGRQACWLFGVTGYQAGRDDRRGGLAGGGQRLHSCAALWRCATTGFTAILLSTAASVLTVTAVIALISQGGYI
jgi:malonate transporter and related proteins